MYEYKHLYWATWMYCSNIRLKKDTYRLLKCTNLTNSFIYLKISLVMKQIHEIEPDNVRTAF
jgi:hypothetical protein